MQREGEGPSTYAVPWASHGPHLMEPPRPLTLRAELTEEDVARIRGAGGGATKLSWPLVLAAAIYVGLRWWLGDKLPDFVLYGLLVGTVLLNGLLAALRGRRHYARPGAISVTLSADGVEVSSETYAGHIGWPDIRGLGLAEDMLVIQTRLTPSLHACPLRSTPPEDLELLGAWLHYHAPKTGSRRGATLLIIGVLGLLALAALWLWQEGLLPALPSFSP